MEETRAVAYVCPHCKETVYAERTAFAMAAAPLEVRCRCGRSTLRMEEVAAGRFRLHVPCGICGGIHDAHCDAAPLFSGRGIALSCVKNHQLCCYIGHPSVVRAKKSALDAVCRDAAEDEETPSSFYNDVIMYEILSELKEIAARGGISCSCSSKRYTMQVHRAAVDLICSDCGAVLRIGAATDEDLEHLCCRMTLEIHGKE